MKLGKPNMRKYDESINSNFINFSTIYIISEIKNELRNNKLINKPPRLYQCSVFKKLKDIRPLRSNGYPVNFNLITKNQSHIPLFTNKPGCNYIEDPYLIVKITLLLDLR